MKRLRYGGGCGNLQSTKIKNMVFEDGMELKIRMRILDVMVFDNRIITGTIGLKFTTFDTIWNNVNG